MWQQIPSSLLEKANTQLASDINPLKVTSSNTIDDVIGVSDSFWKNNHPTYQKIYEIGSNFSKCNLESDSTILLSFLKSIVDYYKLQIRASELSLEDKAEEIQKIELFNSNIDQISEITKILKIKLDKDALLAYILGYSNNIYKQNKN